MYLTCCRATVIANCAKACCTLDYLRTARTHTYSGVTFKLSLRSFPWHTGRRGSNNKNNDRNRPIHNGHSYTHMQTFEWKRYRDTASSIRYIKAKALAARAHVDVCVCVCVYLCAIYSFVTFVAVTVVAFWFSSPSSLLEVIFSSELFTSDCNSFYFSQAN